MFRGTVATLAEEPWPKNAWRRSAAGSPVENAGASPGTPHCQRTCAGEGLIRWGRDTLDRVSLPSIKVNSCAPRSKACSPRTRPSTKSSSPTITARTKRQRFYAPSCWSTLEACGSSRQSGIYRPNEHWNFLVGHLRSDWVSLRSSDDLALPNFAASVRKTTALSANASFIRGGWRDIDETGRTLSDHFLMSVATITHPAEALFEQRFGPKTSFASFAVRRDVWARVGGFPAELTILGDWALALLAASIGDTVYTGDLIAAYRVRSGDGARARHAVQMHESFLMYRDVLPQGGRTGRPRVPGMDRRGQPDAFSRGCFAHQPGVRPGGTRPADQSFPALGGVAWRGGVAPAIRRRRCSAELQPGALGQAAGPPGLDWENCWPAWQGTDVEPL